MKHSGGRIALVFLTLTIALAGPFGTAAFLTRTTTPTGLSGPAAEAEEQAPGAFLPTVCFGFSGMSSFDIGLALYPNGDLWEILEYGQALNGLYDDPALDTQRRIMTNVMTVTKEYILQHDGTLWAFGTKGGEGRETIKLMDSVQAVFEDFPNKLILKEDKSLWTWGLTEFSGSESGIKQPQKLLDGVIAVHDKRVVELETGDYLFLREKDDSGEQLVAQKIPGGFQHLVGFYHSGHAIIVTEDALYSADTAGFSHLMDKAGVKQVIRMGTSLYILKENGDVWSYNAYSAPQLGRELSDVELITEDYFYLKDGTCLDEYRRPIETIITPDMLENARFNEDKLLLTREHVLYTLGSMASRDIAEARMVDTDVKKAIHAGGFLNMFFLVKTDGSLWFHLQGQAETGAEGSVKTKLADGVADIVLEEDTIFVVKEDGSVWGVKPNKPQAELESDTDMEQLVNAIVAVYHPLNARLAVQYGNIPVYLDGKRMTFDAAPFIEDSRTLAPVRIIAEDFGAEVMWDDGEVTIQKGMTTIQLQIGSRTALINGEERKLDVGAQIQNGRTFVPLRFIAEELAFDVQWENGTVVLRSLQS